MELPFAGLHQLCAPMLDRLGALPEPAAGRAGRRVRAVVRRRPRPLPGRPGRAEPAGRGRRGAAAAVRRRRRAVARCRFGPGPRASSRDGCWRSRWRSCSPCASRRTSASWSACRSWRSEGSPTDDARALLATVIPGRLDERVRDRIVAETRGNPLALLELPRGVGRNAAGGRVRAAEGAMRCRAGSRRASCGGSRRSPRTRGCCCWWRRRSRSATRCWCGARPSDSASGPRRRRPTRQRGCWRSARGCRSVIRSCARRSTGRRSLQERRAVHLALAEATDRGASIPTAAPGIWPRRRRHPTRRSPSELERSAGRAQARGGLAAAAAFLERAAALTRRPGAPGGPRAGRRRRPSLQAGAFDAALGLLATAEVGPARRARSAPAWTCCAPRSRIAESRGSDAPRAAAARREDARAARSEARARDLSRRVERGAVRRAAGQRRQPARRLPRRAGRARGRPARRVRPICCWTASRWRSPTDAPQRRPSSSGQRRGFAGERRLRRGGAPLGLAGDGGRRDGVGLRDLPRGRHPRGPARPRVGRAGRPRRRRQRAAPRPSRWAATSASGGIADRRGRQRHGGDGHPGRALRRPRARRPSGPRGRGRHADRRHHRARPRPGAREPRSSTHAGRRSVLFNGLGRYEEALAAAQEASDDTPELFVSAWALRELIEAATRSERRRARTRRSRAARGAHARRRHRLGARASRRARARC